ncbi:unnamed protein product [Rotaria magnacalcarata]|uniref:G-protein coupled receptors family 1 profile domain-containing protein n=1 Tax=Rotaria magnacalcarata TaxID=392030 RepID=A0A816Z532_9BILA|nr:unnamed protein product [Rotaria magnacalcarata]CAF1581229.1 unnamed protein product [Rotaria magnacalcarata]CAF2186398.1 unnamed protein product [Rotaria magnacalcarata]CAF3912259.1 unnamed protein product [Rotaria magnacalcarata]
MSPADAYMTTLELATTYFTVCAGLFIVTLGMIGNILNIIVFLSLETFRKNPCAFCLLILSISESGMLLFFVIPDIFANILMDPGDAYITFPCKLRMAFPQIFGMMTHFIMCYAAIDQRLSTSMPDRHHGINIRIMRHLIMIAIFISVSHSIPFFLFYNVQLLAGTNRTVCRFTDNDGVFSIYAVYINLPVIHGIVPIAIISVFCLIALRNVRSMHKKKVHRMRLHLEQQLTSMVLTKNLSVYITVVPFLIVYVMRYIISNRTTNAILQGQLFTVYRFFMMVFYLNYADSFYIFLACSARFHRQLKFVVFDIYLRRWNNKRNINPVQGVEESFAIGIISNAEQK